ncbi:hypothetical protein E4T56_gene18704 [Termitomyces sp. T112]|nr:hypothetical protein E4T56_gene18704 [Termitomyces sp. T112]
MLHPRPNLTLFSKVLNILLNAPSQTQPHFHRPVALASSQTQPHFVWLGPQYSTQCFIPDPTSLHLVRSLYF